jgi:spermidine synthase
MLVAVSAVLCLLIGLTAMASRITAFAQQHLYFDQIIWQKQTPYQKLVLTNEWPKGDLRLFIDGHIQFSALDEHRYHEALVHPPMGWTGRHETILVLGGGDGLAVREILKHPTVQHIDLVDIDPDMTRLGKSFPPLVELNRQSLSDAKVHVYNQDAFVFVRQSARKYDRVIIDFPDPHNEAISKLYSVEFYALLSKAMSEDAVLVTQSSSPFFARRTFWSIEKTLSAIFPKTTSYTVTVPAFGIWGFHMAHKNSRGSLEKIPSDLKFLTKEVFGASRVFSSDISKPQGLSVNSIFKPNLYQVYLEDLKKGPVAASTAM